MDRKVEFQTGFTVIELVIVIVVGSILLTIAMARFNTVSETANLNDQLHDISSFLKAKRLKAFTEKIDINIIIDGTGELISARLDPGGANTLDGTINLNNPVSPTGTTFTINTRGLYSTTGSIRFTTIPDATVNNCIVIDQERIRLGEWNAVTTSCDAR